MFIISVFSSISSDVDYVFSLNNSTVNVAEHTIIAIDSSPLIYPTNNDTFPIHQHNIHKFATFFTGIFEFQETVNYII